MSSGSNDDKEDPGVELYQYIRNVSNVFDQSSKKKSKSYKRKFKQMANKLVLLIFERVNLVSGSRFKSQNTRKLIAEAQLS